MSVDLNVIIGHTLSPSEIINISELFDTSEKLKNIYHQQVRDNNFWKNSAEKEEELQKKLSSSWYRSVEYPMSENEIIRIWENNENVKDITQYYIMCSLNSYFATVDFNRHTLNIQYNPQHKYANMFYPIQRAYILTFSRAVAELLGQTKIVYCSDNLYSEHSVFNDLAMEGKTIEEIIEYGVKNFGQCSNNLKEAILEAYLVDDVLNPIEDSGEDFFAK